MITIEAIFKENEIIITLPPAWQYDTGQTLTVSGITGINENTEVHFENKLTNYAIVKKGVYDVSSNSLTVDIPDCFFAVADGTFGCVWIYPADENSGRTVREIRIPIRYRKRPENYIEPKDMSREDIIREVIAKYLLENPVIGATLYTLIDKTLSGNSDSAPSLNLSNNNADKDYILYYIDSANVRHNIFNFSQHFTDSSNFYSKAEIDRMIGGIENGSY